MGMGGEGGAAAGGGAVAVAGWWWRGVAAHGGFVSWGVSVLQKVHNGKKRFCFYLSLNYRGGARLAGGWLEHSKHM